MIFKIKKGAKKVMKGIFIQYPKCSTCRNAKKWLDNNNIEYKDRNIVEETPTYEELKEWIERSNKNIKSFFNTSGLVYKSLNLKEKLPMIEDDEKIRLLSRNGMLIKRPLFISDNEILIGFKQDEWNEVLGESK